MLEADINMKYKTLALFEKYQKLLEQGQEEMDQLNQQAAPDAQQGQAPLPPDDSNLDQEMPLTSEAEDQYIEDLVDAALFQPSSEEAKTLLNLQNVLKSKSYTNAREEVLPLVLALIRPETSGNELKDNLDKI
jgi:hypothetical protein